MANGPKRRISTSGLGIKSRVKSISERLAGQVEDLQETPAWKTAGSIILPLASSLLMGPLGAAMGKLPSMLGLIGQGLYKTGAWGKGLLGALKTTGAIGTKSLYNWLGTKGTRGFLDLFDKRSEMDINLKGMDTLSQVLGKEAVEEYREQYTKGKKDTSTQDITTSILGAITQQGDLSKIMKGLMGKKPVSFPITGSNIPKSIPTITIPPPRVVPPQKLPPVKLPTVAPDIKYEDFIKYFNEIGGARPSLRQSQSSITNRILQNIINPTR